jgi:hypothetical protein
MYVIHLLFNFKCVNIWNPLWFITDKKGICVTFIKIVIYENHPRWR